MKNKNILLAADILFNHRLNKTGLKKLPEKLLPQSIEEAYKIQEELKILYLSLNDNFIIGKKVGCTNINAQKQINVSEPFYGNLFSKFSEENNCKLNSKKFYHPYIEPEISFRLKDDINILDAPFSIKDASIIFESIFPSIELVDFRFGENIQKVGIKNLIMTNGASEYYIKQSKRYELDKINLNNQEVKVFINKELIECGNTNFVLGNPLNSAIWLINKLASKGEPMLKGQFITTGTCTKAIKIEKNIHIEADFGALGKIEFEYI
jgi:2-keto-4-pentenoate hydratase